MLKTPLIHKQPGKLRISSVFRAIFIWICKTMGVDAIATILKVALINIH